MNSIIEKEKKLNSVLKKLKNFQLENPDFQSGIKDLNEKKKSIRN